LPDRDAARRHARPPKAAHGLPGMHPQRRARSAFDRHVGDNHTVPLIKPGLRQSDDIGALIATSRRAHDRRKSPRNVGIPGFAIGCPQPVVVRKRSRSPPRRGMLQGAEHDGETNERPRGAEGRACDRRLTWAVIFFVLVPPQSVIKRRSHDNSGRFDAAGYAVDAIDAA